MCKIAHFPKLKVIPLCGKFPLAFGRSRSRTLKDVFSYSLNERRWAENDIQFNPPKAQSHFIGHQLFHSFFSLGILNASSAWKFTESQTDICYPPLRSRPLNSGTAPGLPVLIHLEFGYQGPMNKSPLKTRFEKF